MYLENLAPLDIDLNVNLINSAGTTQFTDTLLSAAHTIAGVDEVFGYLAEPGGRPRTLTTGSSISGVEERVEQYSQSFYRDDPAVWNQAELHLGFAMRISADEIRRRDYRRVCFERPRFAEKLSFGWHTADGLIVLNFYKRNLTDLHAIVKLAKLADIALSALKRIQPSHSNDAFIKEMEARLKRTNPKLARREKEICARTIAGWTAKQISQDLGITSTTVYTYRQRAYRRLNITSATALLPALLH